MHIVHVTAYYPPHAGGMEYRIQELSELFAARGHNITILTSNIGCTSENIPTRKRIVVQYLKSIEIAHTPLSIGLFFHLLRIPRDSVIHLHIAHAFFPEVTYLVCRMRKMPYIATVHLDVSPSGFFGFLLPLYKKWFLAPVIRNAQTVTVLTPDYKRLVETMYDVPETAIVILPNGTYCKPSNKTRMSLHQPVRILFVGRLSVQKNLPLLISAFQQFIREHTIPLHLYIAGAGEREQETRQLIRENRLEQHVTLLGGISANEVQAWYHRSDIFVLPSREESFGSVIIEAMASGIPVIATDILAVRNTIQNGRNGLLVAQNARDLAGAILQLIRDPALRRKLTDNACKDVKQYNWKTIADRFERVYESSLRSTIR